MLQQTTVTAVIPYYKRFLARFPSVNHIAAASLDDVMVMWSGLGYYSRARNLHTCAQQVCALGGFPQTVEELKKLPGIGAYTASAIASMAFGVSVVPVDGNVERIASRVFAIATPLPQGRNEIAKKAASLNHTAAAKQYPGDFAQALFDLGSGICTARSPSCLICPIKDECQAYSLGRVADFPQKIKKPKKPKRYGSVYCLYDQEKIVVCKRPPHGLLGGTLFFPSSEWGSELSLMEKAHSPFLQPVNWKDIGKVEHVFTHFHLQLQLWAHQCVDVSLAAGPDQKEVLSKKTLFNFPLSSVMKECIRRVGITEND
ncbi:A/G-specific adenine glycosylase [Entomobacter blattae]|nr:A/G-specific adenine glycosylase [Entomobacter blattae]